MDKRKRRLLCMLEGSGQKSRWISGAPPLSFKAKKAGTLENYRIYGNTVGGESVGDRTGNLLQNTATSQTINGVTFTVNADGSVTCNGTATATASILLQAQITLNSGSYILTGCPQGGGVNTNYKLDIIDPIASVTVAVDTGSGASLTLRQNMQARIVIYTGQVCDNLTFYPMIRLASIEDDTYEPYGYKVPVTVSNDTDTLTTPIYLPEQIRKVGDEAEYIDYGEQKMHRIGADDIDVTLPELPTLAGTNVLSVGTAVQPSKIEVKGKIKAI